MLWHPPTNHRHLLILSMNSFSKPFTTFFWCRATYSQSAIMTSTPTVAPGELTGTIIVPPRGAAGNNVLGPRILESGTTEGKKRAGKEIARPLTTAIRYTTYANAFRRFLAHHADLKCGWRCVCSKSVLAYIGLGLKEAKLDDFKSGDEVPLTIKFKFVGIWIFLTLFTRSYASLETRRTSLSVVAIPHSCIQPPQLPTHSLLPRSDTPVLSSHPAVPSVNTRMNDRS
jgi:hypothetical protein